MSEKLDSVGHLKRNRDNLKKTADRCRLSRIKTMIREVLLLVVDGVNSIVNPDY